VRERFGDVLARARRGLCEAWAATPRGRLALIVVLDQFSRHIYRGTPDAFAQDAAAQVLCVDGIERGFDRVLTAAERHFFYMPLMHAEAAELQARSIEKFTELVREAESVLQFARDHQSVVARFGRFPTRNEALGRPTTPQEERFLASDEKTFS
jgi:uncharacterized protein (DUF924 family)